MAKKQLSDKQIPRKNRVQSVQRAINILRCLGEEQSEWGVTELSRHLELPKTVIFRLLSTLEDEAFVEQDPETKKYRLGREIFVIAANYASDNDLLRIGDRYLRKLVVETQHTAQIGILDGAFQIPLVVVVSPNIMRVSLRPGDPRPAYATAAGKVLLAEKSDAEIHSLFSHDGLAAITPYTITSAKALISELHKVKQQGYAVNRNESTAGITAVGAPIHDYYGRVVSSISISSPSQFVSEEQIPDMINKVKIAAQELSHLLGNSFQNWLLNQESNRTYNRQ